MFRLIRNKKGQNTAEYAVLIGLVVAAVIAMQTYVKRGVQGRMHDASDKFYKDLTKDTGWSGISTTVVDDTKNQYEPTNLASQSTKVTIEDYKQTNVKKGGTVTRDIREITKEGSEEAGKKDYQKYDYKKE